LIIAACDAQPATAYSAFKVPQDQSARHHLNSVDAVMTG
jgi:hypothetical protein